jgi:flagellar motility protein MotE (MotC chaperone)
MKKLFSPSILAVVVGLFTGTGTGVYWFWRSAEPILAQAAAAQEAEKPPEPARQKGWDFWTIDIENLATELRGERAKLKAEAEHVAQRSAQIATEQQQLNTLRTQIENLQKEISNKVIQIRTDEKKNIRNLAMTYSNLSPRAAIALIRELDDITVVKILSQMKPDVVGPIFEEMSRITSPEDNLARRAAILSEKLRLMQSESSSR